jgi:hypothetical protein
MEEVLLYGRGVVVWKRCCWKREMLLEEEVVRGRGKC